jgi:hypothetical protein
MHASEIPMLNTVYYRYEVLLMKSIPYNLFVLLNSCIYILI